MAKRKREPAGQIRSGRTARTADKYELYLQSVQAPEYEVHFFNRAYHTHFKQRPRVLREDFCGTFAVCCEWVKYRQDNVAMGVDLDDEPLHWGQTHHYQNLTEQQQARIHLHQCDARSVLEQKADVVAAQNFSWFLFMTRETLRDYFKAVRENLADRGILVLDMMGGPDCLKEDHIETRRQKGFKYVWEQVRFDPISHRCKFYIHFDFPDGTRMKRAFGYEWRLWTMPETVELLKEAGFDHVDIYWEGTDRDTGQGNHIYTRRKTAPADLTWVAYVVAVKAGRPEQT